jgi:hypothetical protein
MNFVMIVLNGFLITELVLVHCLEIVHLRCHRAEDLHRRCDQGMASSFPYTLQDSAHGSLGAREEAYEQAFQSLWPGTFRAARQVSNPSVQLLCPVQNLNLTWDHKQNH